MSDTLIPSVDEQIAEARAALSQIQLTQVLQLSEKTLASDMLTTAQMEALYRVRIAAQVMLGDPDSGMKTVDQWMERAHEPESRIEAQMYKADLQIRAQQLNEAMETLKTVQQTANLKEMPIKHARFLHVSGDALRAQGKLTEALPPLKQSLSIYEQLEEPSRQIVLLASIAFVHHLSGHEYEALVAERRAVMICEGTGAAKQNLWALCNNLGESYQRLYAMDLALTYHEKARALLGESYGIDLMRNIGVELIALNRHTEGLAELRKAVGMIEQPDMEESLQAVESLIEALITVGNVSKAQTMLTQLRERIATHENKYHLALTLLLQGQLAHKLDNQAEATQALYEACTAAQSADNPSLVWRTHAMLAELLTGKQPQIAAVHWSIATNILNDLAQTIKDPELYQRFISAPPIAKVLQHLPVV